MEWHLERRLRYIWAFLPDKWDQVMLGHCQSAESGKPLPGAFRSQQTMCTHAYAVSKKSAAHLVRILRTPLFAYSRPMGLAYIWLSEQKHINQFRIYPPVVIQSGSTPGDISGDIVPGEFDLMDSALRRVKLWEARKNSASVQKVVNA